MRVWLGSDSRDYRRDINRKLPDTMESVYIRPYILHNMLIFFMVHLLILVIYFFFKIWDFMNFYKKSFMFKLFNFVEYTLLIVGYLLVIN